MKRTGYGHLTLMLLMLGCAGFGAAAMQWTVRHHRAERNRTYSRIEDGLYLGGSVDVPPPGVQAVLNVCEKDDNYRTSVYVWEPIIDSEDDAPSLQWIEYTVKFIDQQRREGKGTYVHCSSGVSRSAMVVTAYEMYRNHWPRDRALAYIRSARPQVDPNEEFMERLEDWQFVLSRTHLSPGSHDALAAVP